MKKTLIAFAALSMIAGCAKDISSESEQTVEREFIASVDTETRTSLDSDGKVDWSKNDVINYYTVSDGTVKSVSAPENTHSFSFTAEAGKDDTFIIAAYGGAISSPQGKSMTLTTDAVAEEQSGKFEDAHVSVSKRYFETSNVLNFKNVTSLIQFSLTRTDVYYLTFATNDGTKIHGDGKLYFTFSGETFSVKFGDSEGGSSVEVKTNGAGTFYIGTLPCSIEGFTIKCYDSSDNCLGIVTGTKTLTLSSNDIVNLGALDARIVPVPVESISLNKTEVSLKPTKTAQLTLDITPSDAAITSVSWESSNNAVATVSDDGLVTGVAEGTCTVTATVNGNKQAICNVTVSSASSDLSAKGTANCYIVSAPGTYRFNASVKGNSSESVGTIKGAKVLWESFGTATAPSVGDIVSDVSYKDGYVTFTSGKDGNAVIAVTDMDGDIAWSWHIWVCEGYDPDATAQVYNNGAGTMMDRNLGATCTTPGDVGALGLLYQWGRKDPFLSGNSISSSTKAASTLSWPSPISSDSSNGTIAYSVSHPTTFITYNSKNYDWYYTGSSSTDNTRWNSSKGTYDPCPPGYRVPDGGSNGVWAKAFGTGSYWTTSSNWNSTNKGMDFGKTDKALGSGTIWYPASGCLYGGSGSLDDVGNLGNYWSCTPIDYYAYELFFSISGVVSPSDYFSRAYGQSVRCLSE